MAPFTPMSTKIGNERAENLRKRIEIEGLQGHSFKHIMSEGGSSEDEEDIDIDKLNQNFMKT
jgi:hypothetical protein